MKIVYFDVESYEEKFLHEANDGKFEYYLEEDSLNDLNPIKEEYADAEIISVFTTSRVNKKVLQQFKSLKLIALRSVGYNHIDIEYCRENGIEVVNSPNYGNITVAEFALALLLGVARKVTVAYSEYKNAKVSPKSLIGVELSGKTMGIVGLGAIGRAFAKIARGLDMKILAYDRHPKENLEKELGVKYVEFEELLKNSDFISIHAPLTQDNYHMFNESSFDMMKESAILINTGRGELIDGQALYSALVTGKIAGAGLDVLENEETITDVDYMTGINRLNKLTLQQTIINARLFQLDNVIVTPHIAYNTREAIHRILETTKSNIESFVNGKIQNSV